MTGEADIIKEFQQAITYLAQTYGFDRVVMYAHNAGGGPADDHVALYMGPRPTRVTLTEVDSRISHLLAATALYVDQNGRQ